MKKALRFPDQNACSMLISNYIIQSSCTIHNTKRVGFHQLYTYLPLFDCCFFPKKTSLLMLKICEAGVCSFCQGVLGFDFYFILPCCPISLSWVDCDFTSKLPKEAHAKNCFKHFFELDTKWILIMWVHLLFCNKSLGGWLRVIIAQVCSSMIFDSYSEITHHTHTYWSFSKMSWNKICNA